MFWTGLFHSFSVISDEAGIFNENRTEDSDQFSGSDSTP